MLTEQEVKAQLNERLKLGQTKQETNKYLQKIGILQDILNKQNVELQTLRRKFLDIEREIQRTRGAISILLELSAEEEGMNIEVPQITDDSPKTQ